MASLAHELKRVPLFSGLSQRQLKRLARGFRERDVKSGTPVMREGEKSGISFFVIADGSATVTADGPMRCLVMGFWDFRRFAKQNPDVTWKLLQYVVELLSEKQSNRV